MHLSERSKSITINGINEFEVKATIFYTTEEEPLEMKNIADKILDKYSTGVQFIETDSEWNFRVRVTIGWCAHFAHVAMTFGTLNG